MSVQEKEEDRVQILDNIFTTRASGSITKGRHKSLDTQYICASKMHGAHELASEHAFHSHKFGHLVCGAPLDISQREKKDSWRHVCKMGPPNAPNERGDGKCK